MKKVVRYYMGATFVWNAEDETWRGAVMGRPVYVRKIGSKYKVVIAETGSVMKSYYMETSLKQSFFRILCHIVETYRKLFYTNTGFRNFRIVRTRINEWRLYHNNLELIATFLERPYSEAIAYQIQKQGTNIFWERGL